MNGSWNESGSVIGGTSFGRVCEPQLTTWNQLLTAGFGVVFCLSVCGNALVMVTIVQQKWMRTVTNVYLLNLAVSDLLLIVICMPPTLLGLLLRCFIFGHAFCRLVSFLQPVSVTASAYTLAVIALERYFAICKPLSSRHWQTKGHAVKMIALVWTIAIVSNISSLVVADLKEIQPGQFNCAMADWMTPQLRLLNNFFVFLILFLLPLLLMVGLYGLVIRNLWLGIQLETQGYPATPAMSRFYPSPSHPSLSAHSLLPSELESQRGTFASPSPSLKPQSTLPPSLSPAF